MRMRKNARKTVKCPVCMKPFLLQRREQQYCSRSCAHLARIQRANEFKEQHRKRCSRCRDVKPLSGFHRNAGSHDGYRQSCKSCLPDERKERMERVKDDPERLKRNRAQQARASRKKYVKAMALETTGTVEEWMHRLSAPNRMRCMTYEERREREREAEWLRYWGNPEHRKKAREYSRLAHQARPWVMLARKHRRDARLAGVVDDGSVTVEALRDAWEYMTLCLNCGRELTRDNKTVEHMTPMSKGGAHSLVNVIIVCGACNETKRDRHFDEWLERLSEPYRSAAHDRFVSSKYRRVPL